MTPEQILNARILARCTFLPSSYEKRFARDILGIATTTPGRELTEKQAVYFEAVCYRYRVQMASLRPTVAKPPIENDPQ